MPRKQRTQDKTPRRAAGAAARSRHKNGAGFCIVGIGIILSGTGADGSVGAMLAQDPETAPFYGM